MRTPGPPGTLNAWNDRPRRRKRLGIFGVDAALDTRPGVNDTSLCLNDRRSAGRDADLLLDDVDAVTISVDRMSRPGGAC
jgi:hypothetical protein